MTTTSFVVTRREFRSKTFCCYCRTSFRFSLKLLTLIILLMKGALCGPLFPLFSRLFVFVVVELLSLCVCDELCTSGQCTFDLYDKRLRDA